MALRVEVQPEELSGTEQESAKEVAFSARCLDHVCVQSFMDAEYARYRATLPVETMDKPEAVLRAEWARDAYYSLLRRYMESAFLPLIYPDELPEHEQSACLKVLHQAEAVG